MCATPYAQERMFAIGFILLVSTSKVQCRLIGGSGSLTKDPDVIQKLWDGLDLTEQEHADLEPALMQSGAVEEAASAGRPQVQLLGPPDSGTNLIVKSMQLNWPGKVDQGMDLVVWKHSVSSAEDICGRFASMALSDNLTVVLVIRSPISQLTSWRKAGYSLSPCVSRHYSNMGEPCFANTSPDWHDSTPGVKVWKYYDQSLNFSSTMSVYNYYLRQYKDMLSSPACSNIKLVLVRYEDMVFTPEAVLQKISQRAGWPMPKELKQLDTAAKQHGQAHGRAFATQKIRTRAYLKELSDTNLKARCADLQASLVQDQFENAFSASPVSYLTDCQAVFNVPKPTQNRESVMLQTSCNMKTSVTDLRESL